MRIPGIVRENIRGLAFVRFRNESEDYIHLFCGSTMDSTHTEAHLISPGRASDASAFCPENIVFLDWCVAEYWWSETRSRPDIRAGYRLACTLAATLDEEAI